MHFLVLVIQLLIGSHFVRSSSSTLYKRDTVRTSTSLMTKPAGTLIHCGAICKSLESCYGFTYQLETCYIKSKVVKDVNGEGQYSIYVDTQASNSTEVDHFFIIHNNGVQQDMSTSTSLSPSLSLNLDPISNADMYSGFMLYNNTLIMCNDDNNTTYSWNFLTNEEANQTEGQSFNHVKGSSASSKGGKMVWVGGVNSQDTDLYQDGQWQSLTPFGQPIQDHCVCFLDEDHFYVIGGYLPQSNTKTGEAWQYSLPTNEYTQLAMPLKTTVSKHGCVAGTRSNGERFLLVIGGENTGGYPVNIVQKYNFNKEWWVMGGLTPYVYYILYPRVLYMDTSDYFYVFGGASSDYSSPSSVVYKMLHKNNQAWEYFGYMSYGSKNVAVFPYKVEVLTD